MSKIFAALVSCALVSLSVYSGTQAQSSGLVVAWVHDYDLFVWREGGSVDLLAEGGAARPLLSPEGSRIAFIRSAGDAPEALWVADVSTNTAQEIVPPDMLHPTRDGKMFIGMVGWLDETTLFFSTVEGFDWGYLPQDDLYRADAATRKVERILDSGEGGAFSISPDGRYVAIAAPGVYGGVNGVIRLLDTRDLSVRVLLNYEAVSSASEIAFYPSLDWLPDSTALRAAIPDHDLVYATQIAPPTVLWRLGTDGSSQIAGYTTALYNGLPRWSSSGGKILYQAQSADQTGDDLVIAEADGTNPQIYAHSTSTPVSFNVIGWLPEISRFVYQTQPGEFLIGAPGQSPLTLQAGAAMIDIQFADANTYVFLSSYRGRFALQTARFDQPDSPPTIITEFDDPLVYFDTVIAP